MRTAVLVVALSVQSTAAIAGSVAVQWTPEDGGNGHWYDRLIIPNVTYSEAALYAYQSGGYLVTLTSAEENEFVYSELVSSGLGNSGSHGPWIGARADGDNWRWAVTNEPWKFEAWAPDQPDSNASDMAASYWLPDDVAHWADLQISQQLNSFIIEYSDDCNGDGLVDHGQILDGTFEDLNDDGIPDCCQDDSCNEIAVWSADNGGNDNTYQVVLTPGGISWTNANAAAEAAGGHLATATTQEELDFIKSMNFAGTSKGWLGGYQDVNANDYAEPDGGWRWVTSESWEFIGWWFDAPADNDLRNYMQLAYGQCQDEQDLPSEGEWYVIEYGTPTQHSGPLKMVATVTGMRCSTPTMRHRTGMCDGARLKPWAAPWHRSLPAARTSSSMDLCRQVFLADRRMQQYCSVGSRTRDQTIQRRDGSG